VRWSLDLPEQFTVVVVDLFFRMLKWTELALAQGFPRSYQFHGTIEQIVKQIGNAVPCNLAKCLFKAAISQSPN
jgi:site-specific DNA-cytosine methylase